MNNKLTEARMKKSISLLLILSITILAFASCGSKNDAKGVKIGLAAPAATHGWVAGVAYYAEKYCNEKELDYKLTTSDDAAEMEKNIEDMLNWNAEAIILWPQWSGMEDVVDSVIEKGIPVVGFDVDIDCEGIYKVTGNNYDMGYQCAKYISEKAGDAAYIAVLNVPSVGSVSQLRVQGFYDYLAEIGYDTSNIFEIEEESFSRDAGYSDMMKALGEHSRIDAVFSLDDETSIGVVKAITESRRSDVKAITGGGGMQEYFKMISDAKFEKLGLCSALYSPSMIEDAIKTAIDRIKGNNSSKIVVIPTTIVDASNVDQYIDQQNNIY